MTKTIKRKQLQFSSAVHPADMEMASLRYTDLKIACIEMGMSFQAVISGDHSTLSSFYKQNHGTRRDTNRLIKFEAWLAEKLIKRGYDPKDPLVVFKLSSAIEIPADASDDEAPKTVKKIKAKVQVPKKKREVRDGVVKGTKKDLTFQLTKKGLPVGKVIEKVLSKFPDAQEKSIKIWYRKAQRLG
jgi:hypothetical protein